jgi:hypothetical protein
MAMRFIAIIFFFGTILTETLSANTQPAIKITNNGTSVCANQRIEGDVYPAADTSNGNVWIVVHPLSTADFWVQTEISINDQGHWVGHVNFGRPNMDAGEEYEYKAFYYNPRQQLTVGAAAGWPSASSTSSNLISGVKRAACNKSTP